MKSWEDFLDNYDQAQPNVKVSWGPEIKQQPKDYRKQRNINLDKLASGTGPKPPAVNKISPKDQERIKKLEAVVANAGATKGEKNAARAAIERIKNRG